MKKAEITLGVLAILSMSSSALAQSRCHYTTLSCPSLRVSICPSNDFEFVRTACGGDYDYIEVWATDWMGNGIPGVPPTDYWMEACDALQILSICWFVTADSVTSSLPGFVGRTTISGRIRGGGCVLSGGISIFIQGQQVFEDDCWTPICLDVQVVSPDIDGDQVVDLSDLGIFGLSYNKSEGEADYNDCCDFNDNGVCDLSDFAFFGRHYQHVCF